MTGASSRFPTTRRSAVFGTRSLDPAARRDAWDRVITAYWKPVYKYIRLRWNKDADAAQDLAQGFFANSLDKQTFAGYDPLKGTFRTYLRTCLDGFLSNENRSARRVKRGGEFIFDYIAAEAELRLQIADPQLPAEELFHREWQRQLFALAVEDLRSRRGGSVQLRVFERYDLAEEPPTYAALAAEFGLSAATVTNYLAAMRRDLRRCALERLRDMTIDEREFQREARALLGGAGE